MKRTKEELAWVIHDIVNAEGEYEYLQGDNEGKEKELPILIEEEKNNE